MICTLLMLIGVILFFFKQNTAYELRISECSSDVCSSDLIDGRHLLPIFPQGVSQSSSTIERIGDSLEARIDFLEDRKQIRRDIVIHRDRDGMKLRKIEIAGTRQGRRKPNPEESRIRLEGYGADDGGTQTEDARLCQSSQIGRAHV